MDSLLSPPPSIFVRYKWWFEKHTFVIMRLAVSLACKGETVERITSFACNMITSFIGGVFFMELKDKLQLLRKQNGYSQEQLADKLIRNQSKLR